MSTTVNEIKAGEYELVAELWDEPKSKPGDPYFDFVRHRKGDKVKLDVETARRLVTAGAVVKPGDREKFAAEQARAAYVQALAALTPEMRDQVAAGELPEPVEPAQSEPPAGGAPSEPVDDDLPPRSASKATWVDAAVERGMTQEAAEAMTRDELAAHHGVA